MRFFSLSTRLTQTFHLTEYAEELLNENVLSYDQLREDLKSVIRNFDNLPLESFPEISLQNSFRWTE